MKPKEFWWKADNDWLNDLEWATQWVKPAIKIDYHAQYKTELEQLKQENADLKEENKALTKAFSDAERKIDRVIAENERLKQELAEARELSLF